jgi:hypothetical protein
MSDELQRSMGRVEGKLDSLLEAFSSAQEKTDKRFEGHDGRISAAEKKIWLASGAWAFVMATASYVVGWIKH